MTTQWQKKLDKKGIQVYTAKHPTSPYDRYKAIMEVEGALSHYVALLQDVENYKNWMHTTVTSKLIKQSSVVDNIAYISTRAFPAKDRDYYAKITLHQNDDHSVVSSWNCCNDYPINTSCIRLRDFSSTVKLLPNNQKNRIVFIFEGHADPGGIVPHTIVNRFLIDIPFNTLLRARKMVGDGKYSDPVSYIEDYATT